MSLWLAICITYNATAAGAAPWHLYVAAGHYGTFANVYARAGVHAPVPAIETRSMQATGPMASFLAGCH